MAVKVIVFGQLAEITGSEIFIEACDTDILKAALQIEFSNLAVMKYAIAVNNIVITEKVTLTERDEIALMPPYSGG
ncbi:MoaD/ThiS family protein [Flavobacterium rhizosphaerae]|uniref:MoaD/ThiS family protein n=1 Tax=Flavobacterium rhizosphaerae TaxID=3163298 RepID=A0ABW8YV69_9FLAO